MSLTVEVKTLILFSEEIALAYECVYKVLNL